MRKRKDSELPREQRAIKALCSEIGITLQELAELFGKGKLYFSHKDNPSKDRLIEGIFRIIEMTGGHTTWRRCSNCDEITLAEEIEEQPDPIWECVHCGHDFHQDPPI